MAAATAQAASADQTWYTRSFWGQAPRYRAVLDKLFSPPYANLRKLQDFIDPADADATAVAIVNLSMRLDCILDVIEALVHGEFEANFRYPATILRGNSLASKVGTIFCRKTGCPYLQTSIGPIISQVTADEKVSFEVDPVRLKRLFPTLAAEDLTRIQLANRDSLVTLASSLFARITAVDAIAAMPREIRSIGLYIGRFADRYLSAADPLVRFRLIGGFFFLRFINPATVTPESFGLAPSDSSPPPAVRRNLLLISKLMQSLANGVPFGAKEPHMVLFNDFIAEYLEPMRAFLNSLATVSEGAAAIAADSAAAARAATATATATAATATAATAAAATAATAATAAATATAAAAGAVSQDGVTTERMLRLDTLDLFALHGSLASVSARWARGAVAAPRPTLTDDDDFEPDVAPAPATPVGDVASNVALSIAASVASVRGASGGGGVGSGGGLGGSSSGAGGFLSVDSAAALSERPSRPTSVSSVSSEDPAMPREAALHREPSVPSVERAQREEAEAAEFKAFIALVADLGDAPPTRKPKAVGQITAEDLAAPSMAHGGGGGGGGGSGGLAAAGSGGGADGDGAVGSGPVTPAEIESSKLFFRGLPNKAGAPVFYLIMARMHVRLISNLDALAAAVRGVMGADVNTPYALVIDMSWVRATFALKKQIYNQLSMFASIFDRQQKKNCKAIYIIHPSSFTRTVLFFASRFTSKKFRKKIHEIYEWEALHEHIHPANVALPEASKEYIAKTFHVIKVNAKGKEQGRLIKFTHNSLLNIEPKTQQLRNERLLNEIAEVRAPKRTPTIILHFGEDTCKQPSVGFLAKLRQNDADSESRTYLCGSLEERNDIVCELFARGFSADAFGFPNEFDVEMQSGTAKKKARAIKLTCDSLFIIEKAKIKKEIAYSGVESITADPADRTLLWMLFKGDARQHRVHCANAPVLYEALQTCIAVSTASDAAEEREEKDELRGFE